MAGVGLGLKDGRNWSNHGHEETKSQKDQFINQNPQLILKVRYKHNQF